MDKADLRMRFQRLTRHRQEHVARVTAVMEVLADRHGLDPEEARWAGYGHDLARELSRPDLLSEAHTWRIPVNPEDAAEPLLLHGPIAAAWLKAAAVGSPAVWEAVRHHTTAGPDLGRLAQALFIADGVEPGRKYPERQVLYEAALADLEKGYRLVLEHTAQYLTVRGLALHSCMQAALLQLED